MPSLRTLEPHFRPLAEEFFSHARAIWPGIVVTSARRSRLEQARLFARYQRGESNLPAAPPGRSDHEVGLAFDMARPQLEPREDPALASLGYEWRARGGRWDASDPVHFAAPAYIADFWPRGISRRKLASRAASRRGRRRYA